MQSEDATLPEVAKQIGKVSHGLYKYWYDYL
jgi:hypothetical protein